MLTIDTGSQASAVAWSPDGSRLAAALENGTRIGVWDGAGRKLSEFPVGSGGPDVNSPLAFVAGSSQLMFDPPYGAADDVILSVRDASTGQIVKNIKAVLAAGASRLYYGHGFAISPDQELLAVKTLADGGVGDVSIANTKSGTLTRKYMVGEGALSVNFLAHGSRLVVGSGDGVVGILNPSSSAPPRLFKTFQSHIGVGSVAGSPDGRLIFAGGAFVVSPNGPKDLADDVHVVRVSDGALIASFPAAPDRLIEQAEWDPLGRYVAFVDNSDDLFLWRPLSRTLSYKALHLPGALTFSITQDGSRIAVGALREIVVFRIDRRGVQ
jgi:WD40 repeat protein